MRWSKALSRTDAQQPTGGRPVEYLRFTKSNNPQNNQVWFRSTFFAGHAWSPGVHGKNAVEECTVPIDVFIAGASKGSRNFRVTHDGNRGNNNSTPNTYLHYDGATIADLRALNLTGHDVVIERLPNGTYTLSFG